MLKDEGGLDRILLLPYSLGFILIFQYQFMRNLQCILAQFEKLCYSDWCLGGFLI